MVWINDRDEPVRNVCDINLFKEDPTKQRFQITLLKKCVFSPCVFSEDTGGVSMQSQNSSVLGESYMHVNGPSGFQNPGGVYRVWTKAGAQSGSQSFKDLQQRMKMKSIKRLRQSANANGCSGEESCQLIYLGTLKTRVLHHMAQRTMGYLLLLLLRPPTPSEPIQGLTDSAPD